MKELTKIFSDKYEDSKMRYDKYEKIEKNILDKINHKDVYTAIERWNSDEEFPLRKYKENNFYLLYNGTLYPTKLIFALAYENHYGTPINTTNLWGGDKRKDNNGVVSHLRDRLKFNVINVKKETLKKYNEETAYLFLKSLNQISEADLPTDEAYIPVPEKKKSLTMSNGMYSYPRSESVALKALKRANYQCECQEKGKTHPSFIRKKNGTNYTEPHHLIPMCEQDDFKHSLDVPANIVSLCSNCHNQLHYGKDYRSLLEKLYEARKDELKAAGIGISRKKLISYYE